MSITHIVGYSQSARAKCHGPPPCQGSLIDKGSLRYGQKISASYGDAIEWRHWGCVTPEILAQLAALDPSYITDFLSLRMDDQIKIRTAIHRRLVNPEDVPSTAIPPPPAVAAPPVAVPSQSVPSPVPSQKQRRVIRDAALATATPSQSIHVVTTKPPSPKKRKAISVAPTPAPASASTSAAPASQSYSQALVEPENESFEEEAPEELYVSLKAVVVGIQYYQGLVGAGEEVLLQREPHNAYDSNAIRVDNMNHIQVGHIKKTFAAKMAPLMDRRLVNCEAIIHDGNMGGGKIWTLDVTVRFYGRSDRRNELEPLLKWATPGQRGFPPRPGTTGAGPSYSIGGAGGAAGPSQSQYKHVTTNTQAKIQEALKLEEARRKAVELSKILNTLEKVDDEGRRSSLLDSVCSTDDLLSLPLHPSPPGISKGDLLVDLMRHQSQGLQWCIEREYPKLPKGESDKPVQFWQVRNNPKKNSNYYFNIATKTPVLEPPPLGRGALFADAMGLGKTLTMIALVLATKADKPTQSSNSTLIVVPLSVISNWEKQLYEHTVSGALKTHVYYGSGRSISSEDLAQYDVVLTTYQVCVTEHAADAKAESASRTKKRKVERTLFDVKWKRIILDEGHCIRNSKTKMAKAVCGMDAERRWVLTGTPIINSPRDLGSLLTFLRICRPLDNDDFFKRLLLRPLKNGDPSGAELLRALMNQVCLRRTKEMQDSEGNPLISLPPVEMILVPVSLHEETRKLYDQIEDLSKQRIEGFFARGEVGAVTSNVLSMLTRMRQLVLHPGLVPKDYVDQLKAMLEDDNPNKPQIALTPADRSHLQARLLQAIEDSEECPVCFSAPDTENARITACAHVFCISCITEIIARQAKCPMDRRDITVGDVIEPPPPTLATQVMYRDDDEETFDVGSSAKIDQLIHLLQLMPTTEKSLVFSQFTSFLDKIAEELDERGIAYERFDGRMSAKRRQEVLARFSVPIAEDKVVDDDNSMTVAEPTRRRKASRRQVMNGSDVEDDFPPSHQDSDFTPMGQDDDDDDFIVSDGDNSYSSKKPKGKGKAKANAKGKAKAKASSTDLADDLAFGNGGNPKVLLLSLKAGALGLNLTVANNVFMMDPWWQEGIESQAIDRVNRIGQKKDVHVYQLIAENTVEAKVLDIQEKKKALIQQAFAGQKRKETPHQRKEARLQEIIELFGIRNTHVST